MADVTATDVSVSCSNDGDHKVGELATVEGDFAAKFVNSGTTDASLSVRMVVSDTDGNMSDDTSPVSVPAGSTGVFSQQRFLRQNYLTPGQRVAVARMEISGDLTEEHDSGPTNFTINATTPKFVDPNQY
jgi:hypothetical protein